MKKRFDFSKIRSNRVKYLKLFPLFIHDIDQTEENAEHWPCFDARIVDDLIIIPDVEQAEKLFRYGSFGKSEFTRTSTSHTSPSLPLEIIPNNKLVYERPYRLRSIEYVDDETDAISDFERQFLDEFKEKIFCTSLDEVRQEHTRILPRTNVEIPSTKSIVREQFYLLPEETIFLQHTFGCLNVKDEQSNSLSLEQLYQRFLSQDKNFYIKYAVYYYFRSVGWIVKSGLKFGCDYMIYRFGPIYNHADYCVSIENFWNKNSCTWSFISALNRTCLNAGKMVLLVRVQLPRDPLNNLEDFLQHTEIQTLEINRWIPT